MGPLDTWAMSMGCVGLDWVMLCWEISVLRWRLLDGGAFAYPLGNSDLVGTSWTKLVLWL
jgi:hypothetical protein